MKKPFGDSIVVGVDLQSDWENVVDHALARARQWKLPVHIVHVIEKPGRSLRRAFDAATLRIHVKELRRQARERMTEFLDEHDVGVPAKIDVRSGSAAEELMKAAKDRSAGLIVLGVRRKHEERGGPLGTVPDRILRVSSVPTLVVFRESPRPLKKILVPVDMDRPDEGAVRLACTLAAASRARVSVLHAYAVPSLLHGYLGNVSELRQDARESARKELEAFIAGTCVPEDQPQPKPILKAQSDSVHAAEVIASESERLDIDMIVMALGQHGMLHQLVIGGTAEKLLRYLPCHLMALPASWARKR